MSEPVVKKTSAVRGELGVTGLKRFSGRVEEEFLQALKGEKAVKVYTEMESNDPIIGACLLAITLLARQAKWRVDPPSEKREDRDNAKFVDECMNDMSVPFSSVVDEALTMLPFGWAWHEVVYKQRKGYQSVSGQRSRFNDAKIGWRKMPLRAQDSMYEWVFDEKDGGIQAMVQMAPPDYKQVTIPIERSLLFRTTHRRGNPEGRSILRNAYRPWYFKRRIEEIEGIGVERDLAGLPIAYVDPEILLEDASDEEVALRTSIENLVKNVRRDQAEGILFPRIYDDDGHLIYEFDLLSGAGGRQFSTDQIITRYDQRIAMTMMGDFILLGHEKVGSFALSDNKTSLFAVAIGTFLDEIADILNRHAVPRLFEVNGMQPEQLPTIRHEDIETPELGQLGAYISSLAGVGVPLFPDDELENYLRAAASLPPKKPGQEGEKPQDQQQKGTWQDGRQESDKPPEEDQQQEPQQEKATSGPPQFGGYQ